VDDSPLLDLQVGVSVPTELQVDSIKTDVSVPLEPQMNISVPLEPQLNVSVPLEPQLDVSVPLAQQLDVSPHNAMYH
jgi:hypothetical protein